MIRKANSLSRDFVIVNGVDRRNNLLGYNKVNCVACCPFCNYTKKELTETDFLKKDRTNLSL